MNHKEREAQTCLWCMSAKTATSHVAKMREMRIDVPCYAENNTVILKRNLTKSEYKKLYSSKV